MATTLFLAPAEVKATPIDNFKNMSCEEYSVFLEDIFDRDLLETKEIRESSQEIYQVALDKNCASLADAMNLMAFQYYNKNQPLKVSEYLAMADSIIQATDQIYSKANVRNKMYQGLNIQIGGNLKLAHIYFEKALEISERISFTQGKIQAYLNLSLYYIGTKETSKARELLEKATEFNDGNQLLTGYVYHNLSRCYLYENNYDKAIEYSKVSEKIWNEIDFSKGLHFVNAHLAGIKLKLGDTIQWKQHIDKALFFGEKDESFARHGIYHTLAWYHANRNEDDKAIYYFEKAFDQSASFEENELVNITGALISLYEKKGDLENIKRVNQKAIDFFDKKSEKYINEAEKWQVTELRLENKIRENEFLKFRSKAFLISWISTIGVFIILGFLLFKYFRQKSAQKRMKDAQEFRSLVSSNLHDNVGSTLAGLAMKTEMMSLEATDQTKEDLLSISKISRDAMTSLRDTVWAIDVRKDRFKDLADKMIDFGQEHLAYKKFEFIHDIKCKTPYAFIEPEKRQTIYLIFKEAITNILKHSNGDLVVLKLRQNGRRFKMSIKDNGAPHDEKISAGSGLENMKSRAEKIGGKLKIKKEDGFKISLVIEN